MKWGVGHHLPRALEGQRLPFGVATRQHGGPRSLSPLTPPAHHPRQPRGEVRLQPVLGLEATGPSPWEITGLLARVWPQGDRAVPPREEKAPNPQALP